ncbi:MAG: hypothetical protein RLZZ435_2195 [Cyanobacteriota bacterium]|jgi:hypothetical protein
MANPNPKIEHLLLNRGRRPKLDHEQVSMRMSAETKAALEALAGYYGCFYGDKPWISGLLQKVARRELLIVPAPPEDYLHSEPAPASTKSSRQGRKKTKQTAKGKSDS